MIERKTCTAGIQTTTTTYLLHQTLAVKLLCSNHNISLLSKNDLFLRRINYDRPQITYSAFFCSSLVPF